MGGCNSNRNSKPDIYNPDLGEYIKRFTFNNQEIGIGVLCKIPLKNISSLEVLILHSQLLKKEGLLPENKIILKSKSEPILEIPIDNFENIYNDTESNISIIEIKKEIILNNQKFLEIDEKPEEYSDKKYCIALFLISKKCRK